MRVWPVLLSTVFFLTIWWAISTFSGSPLIPAPEATLSRFLALAASGDSLVDVGLTMLRGLTALLVSFLAALILGLPAGFHRRFMEAAGPLVAAMQSCPAIVWISLLMVFWGTGSSLPVAVAAAALFPPLFANAAQGTASLDRKLFDLARVYRVPKSKVLFDLILPGLKPFFLAGLSYALGAVWRVVTMAEFLGSSRGVGAKIYWSYRLLDMPALFCWTGLVVLFGLALEWGVVRPLRSGMERDKS